MYPYVHACMYSCLVSQIKTTAKLNVRCMYTHTYIFTKKETKNDTERVCAYGYAHTHAYIYTYVQASDRNTYIHTYTYIMYMYMYIYIYIWYTYIHAQMLITCAVTTSHKDRRQRAIPSVHTPICFDHIEAAILNFTSVGFRLCVCFFVWSL